MRVVLRTCGAVLGAGALTLVPGAPALAETSAVAKPSAVAQPSAKQAPAQSYTYKGVTYSWTRADGADLVVRMTPSAPDRLPAGVAPASVPDTSVPRAPDPGVRGDGCTGVPDGFGAADFYPACERHDACYGKDSRTDRSDCDAQLASDLFRACRTAYPRMNDPFRVACNAVGVTYYVGVRVVGWTHYQGQGSALSARRDDAAPEVRAERR